MGFVIIETLLPYTKLTNKHKRITFEPFVDGKKRSMKLPISLGSEPGRPVSGILMQRAAARTRSVRGS
jgi:hypothetical protein